MSQRAAMQAAASEPEARVPGAVTRLVALIGPNDASRRVVARALAASGNARVSEFVAYPSTLGDVPRLKEHNFDLLIIDVDSDESYALAIIQEIASFGTTVPMAYSQRNQPELVQRCKQAGARDFLSIPAEPEPAPAAPPEPPAIAQVMLRRRASLPEAMVPRPASTPATDRPPLPPRHVLDPPAATRAVPSAAESVLAPPPAAPAPVDRPPLPPRSVLDAPAAPRVVPLAPPAAPAPLPDSLASKAAAARKPAAPEPSLPELDPPIFRFAGMASPPEEEERRFPRWIFAGVLLGVAGGLVIAFLPEIRQALPSGIPLPWNASANSYSPYQASASKATGSATPAGTVGGPAAAAPAAAQPAASTDPAAAPLDLVAASTPATDPASARTAARTPYSAPAPVSAPAMDRQLRTPSRISGDLKRPVSRDESSASFAPSGLEASNASMPTSAFASQHNVRIAPPPAAISAGVASGMLIRRTEPVYPEFARRNHIGGTVVIGGMIAKTGQLQNLHVISGPATLRDSALAAARTWRYRPYKLNNQPVEVQTTISIVFNPNQ